MQGEDVLILTLSNSERHIFASEEPGVLAQWYEVLATPSSGSGGSSASETGHHRPATTMFPAVSIVIRASLR